MTMSTAVALLRLPQVLAQFPVSRAAWYEGIKDGRYPPPMKLGPRSVAWKQEDIDRLVASLCAKHPMQPD